MTQYAAAYENIPAIDNKHALCESATEFQDKEIFVEMATFLGTDKRVGVSLPIQE